MSFNDLLEELKAEYVQELPQKIASIRKTLASSDHSPVREDFHKLKGTGKTYGIPEISELAEVVEMICVRRPAEIRTFVPEALEILENIHARRTRLEAFDIHQDQRFSRLKHWLVS